MEKTRITVVLISQMVGTAYEELAWWGLDECGCAVIGPRSSKRKLYHAVADFNRFVKAGTFVGPALTIVGQSSVGKEAKQ